MNDFRNTFLTFSTSAKPTLSSQRLRSGFICVTRYRQFYNTRRASHLRRAIFRTHVSSSAGGAPIFGATMPTIEEELTVTSSDGCEVSVYYVRPEEDTGIDGCGVILMTDILGFKNEDTRSVAKRFAEAGLPTVVPDLFREEPWTTGRSMTEYETWRSQHDPVRVRQDLKSSYDFLVDKGFANRLGMVGFCYGGGRLMEEIAMASQGLNPKVAIAFYPTRFQPESVGRNATCFLLFISGDEDELVPMSVIQKLQDSVINESCTMEDCEIRIVEGAGHAFAHHPKTEQNKIDGELSLSHAVKYLTSKL